MEVILKAFVLVSLRQSSSYHVVGLDLIFNIAMEVSEFVDFCLFPSTFPGQALNISTLYLLLTFYS